MTKKYVSKIVKGGQTLYIKDLEAATLIPVDISTLTPSSTFVTNNVLGINGVLYRAKNNTSTFPVTLATQDGAFVVNTINGKICFIVTDTTLDSNWEIWTDASIEYWVDELNTSLAGKQNTISDLSTIRSGAAAGATAYQKPSGGIPSTDLASAVQTSLGKADTSLQTTQKGAVNGLAELDANGKVPSSQLPSYVDDVVNGYYKTADGKFYKNKSGSTYSEEITGEEGKIYIDLDTNKTYRWNGSSAFVVISETLALGETSSTAYRGDHGKTAYDHSQNGDVHVTTAQKTAWSAKYDKPSGGIPSTDMASAVTTSLGKADTAYQKPSGGIPSTDMSSAVQTSLGKADSALQSHQSVVLASGTNNGTMKITVNGTATDNVAVTGLGTAAYKGVATDVNTSENLVPANKVKAYVDARALIPVDEEALTTSSTFVKGNVVGINGTFYYCTADTSNFPVILATQDGAFVVNVIDGKRCFIVTDNTVQTGWMLWADASVEYYLANYQSQIDGFGATLTSHTSDTTVHITAAERTAWNAKQSALTFDDTPTENSPNPVTSGGVYTALQGIHQSGVRPLSQSNNTCGIGEVMYIDGTSIAPNNKVVYINRANSATEAYEYDIIVNVATSQTTWSIEVKAVITGGYKTQVVGGHGPSHIHVIGFNDYYMITVTEQQYII